MTPIQGVEGRGYPQQGRWSKKSLFFEFLLFAMLKVLLIQNYSLGIAQSNHCLFFLFLTNIPKSFFDLFIGGAFIYFSLFWKRNHLERSDWKIKYYFTCGAPGTALNTNEWSFPPPPRPRLFFDETISWILDTGFMSLKFCGSSFDAGFLPFYQVEQ